MIKQHDPKGNRPQGDLFLLKKKNGFNILMLYGARKRIGKLRREKKVKLI